MAYQGIIINGEELDLGGLFEIPISMESFMAGKLSEEEISYITENDETIKKGAYVNVSNQLYATLSAITPAGYIFTGDIAQFILDTIEGTINTSVMAVAKEENAGKIPVVNEYGNGFDYEDKSSLGGGVDWIATDDSGELPEVHNGIAIGYHTKALGNSIAIGNNVIAGINSTSIYYPTKSDAVVIGYNSYAYNNSVIIGSNSGVSGTGASPINVTVIGYNSTAVTNAIAIGAFSNAGGINGIAIGYNTKALDSVAIGSNVNAGRNSIAILSYYAKQTGSNSIAIGVNTKANDYAISLGDVASASNWAIALGKSSSAGADYSVAIGASANVQYDFSIAIGYAVASNSKAERSVSIGSYSSVTGSFGVAIGFGAKTNALNSIAIGANTTTNSECGIAIGTGASTGTKGIKIGYGDEENVQIGAYNLAELGGGGGSTDWFATTATGNPAKAVERGSMAIGYDTFAGDYSIAIGLNAKASVDTVNTAAGISIGRGANSIASSVAVGTASYANSFSAAVGHFANAQGTYAVAIGYSANAIGLNSIAIGYQANAFGCYSTSIGHAAYVNGNDSVGLGSLAGANGVNSTAVGSSTVANGSYSTVIGYNARTEEDNTIVLGDANIVSLQCAVQTITSLSDERTKEDITHANTARCLEIVEKLPVKRFKFKKFARPNPLDKHKLGFIAQDVEEVFPNNVQTFDEKYPVLDDNGNPVYEYERDEFGNLVYEQVGEDEEGKPIYADEPKMVEKKFTMKDVKHLGFEQAIPSLWGAVQELTKRVKDLTERIEWLEDYCEKRYSL